MKNILAVILIIAIVSCKQKENIENMYQKYYGSYFKLTADNKMIEHEMTIELFKDTIIIKEQDSVIYNGEYSIKENKITIPEHIFYIEIIKDKNKLILNKYIDESIDFITYSTLLKKKVDEFAEVKLTADIFHLSEKEKKLLSILFDVANIMDELFWEQVCPNKDSLLATITDENAKKFFFINYGPYEQLKNNKPFIPGVPPFNPKVTFYPHDMTLEEFEKWNEPQKSSWYTIIRRNEKGELIAIPYSEFYKEKLSKAAQLLNEAANYAENPSLKKYLIERAKAFQTNNYFESDMAWMDLKNNNIDFVVGPIESYTDEFLGYKTAFESFILLKDIDWSNKLNRYAELLPQIQKNLPVEEQYKKEKPAKGNELAVYQAVYYAGDCNAGSKSIAINLPNDKKVNELKGSRKLQLKNSMKAKFDNILVPIAKEVIDDSQLKNISFDAFFENVMFHEVAHGLGISKTITNGKLVTEMLKDANTTIEEAKADILGLYIATWLYDNKYLQKEDILDNYVTFLASIFRSIRFGAASAHGKANMIEFNYLLNKQAFIYNEQTGKYTVNLENMRKAVSDLGREILIIQGNGDYTKAKEIIANLAVLNPLIQKSLSKISHAGIPRDIVFEQGKQVVGL